MSLDDAAQEARRLLTQNTVQESLDYLATITKTIDESSSNLRRIIGGSYLDVMHACEEVVGMRTTCADLWRIQSALSSTPHNKSDAEKSSPPRSWSPVTAIRAKALPSSLSGTVKEELGLLPLLDSLSAASGSNSVSTTAATQPNGLLVHEDHDKRSSSAAETSISHLGHLQEQLCAVEGYFAADSVVEAARTLRDIRRQLEQHQHSDSSKDERLERHLLLNVTAYERRLLQRVETNLHRDAREAALYAIDGTAKMAATSYSRGREGFAESWKSSLAAARQRWRSLSLALQYLQPSMELLSELLSVSEGSTEVELSQDVNPALIAVQDVLRFSNMSSLRGVIRHAEGSTDSVRSSPSHLTVMVLLMCDLLRQHAKSVGQNLHRGDEEQQFVAVGVESNDPAATSLAWAVEALILMVQLSSYLAALVSPEGTEATVQEALEPWSIDQRAMDALGSKQVLRKLIEARQTVSTMPTPADVSDSVAAKARGVSASSAVGDGKTLTTARRSTKAYRDYLLRAVGTHRAVRGTMFEAEADRGHHPEPFVVPDHSKGVAEVVAVLPLVAAVAESILRPYLRAVFTPFCRDPRTIRTLRELWSMHLSPALAHSVEGLAKVSTTSSAFLHSVKDGVEEVVSEALTQELQRTLRSAERLQKAFVEELGIDPSPMDGREKTASQHTLLPNSLSLHQMVRHALGKHTAWSTSMPGTSIGRESLGLPQHAQTTRGVWKQRIGEALRVERGPSRGVGAESTAVGQHTSSDRERSVIHAIYPAVQTSNTESPQCSSDSPSVSSWIEALVQLVKLVDIMRGVFGGSERLRATSAQPSQDDGWRQAILQWARESLNCFTEVEQRLRALAAGDSQDLKNPVHVACRLYELAALVDVYRVSLRSLLEVLLRDASNYPSAGNPLPPVTPSALERHLEAFQSQAKDLYERCHRPWIMAVTSEWMNFVEGLYTRQFGLPPPSTAEPRFPTPSAGGISDRGGDGGSFPTRLSPDLLGGISQLQGIVLALLDCRPGIHSISASSSRISGVIDRNGTLASNGGPSQPASCVGQTAPYISQSVRADLYLSILEAIPETIERRVLATLSTAKSVSTAAAEVCMQLFLDVYAQKLLFARCVPEGSSCQPATAASIVRRADAAEQRLQQLLLNISRSIDPVRWHHAQGPIRQAGEVLVVRAALFLGIPATHSVGAKALALDGADSSAPVLHKKADAPRFALLPIASTAASSSALTAGAGAGGVGLFRAASPEALASGMLGTRTRPAMEDVVGHAAPTPSAGNAPHVGMSLWNSTQRGWSSLWGAGEKGDAIR